ncbi:polyprotein [Sesamum angolense]|uniref:Polyprotein n=1 Tax=Sesamum angolense TaxID=2727404 RepID=A0AAE2BLZ6_9LAMI|nr:polyprotein [Sesamum angolense]
MLSNKKSFIGQPNIDFLGMKLVDGRYQPGPHITQELLKFPEENLTTKEIQQFLGIVNYIKDFIPECSQYTSQLSKLLKKEPPPWGQAQTMALQKLKQVCQQPLPLKIPGTGYRILQTDASNEFWGAILIEEENGKKHFCGHASGQFKDTEKHYHAVYKEILAIKYGIKKFEFHLIGHHFTIMMDNTSFPKIMDLKNKGVPEPQLLRLKDWFSKYQFTVKHIKGDANLIPDFLSRPSGIHLISPTGTIPIFMASNSSSTSRSPLTFPLGFFRNLTNIGEYALDNILEQQFQQTLDEGKSYTIIILHRPYYEGTGEARPLPLCRTWKSLEKPLIEQKHEGQKLARHLCFVNKIPIPSQCLKLVYTSLAIESMDEDSDDDPIPEPDSQDPWDYGTNINLESPATSFYHGGPSTSA